MPVTLSFLLLACLLLSTFNIAEGLDCYTCTFEAGMTPKNYHACLNADSEYSKPCFPTANTCFKASGDIGGKPAGMRKCAIIDKNFIKEIGGYQCLPLSTPKLKDLANELMKSVSLENGTICLCDGHNCNGARNVGPGASQLVYTFSIFFGMLLVLKSV